MEKYKVPQLWSNKYWMAKQLSSCKFELRIGPGKIFAKPGCPGCGASIKNGQKFCLNCGLKVVTPSELPSCHDCGAQITRDLKFCLQCGKKI